MTKIRTSSRVARRIAAAASSAVVALALGFGSAAVAEDPPAWPSLGGLGGAGGFAPLWLVDRALSVCGQDIYRHCSGVTPGGGRIAQCLADQYEVLSPECQTGVDRAAAARNMIFACYSDARRLCDGVLPGGGRVMACLSEQEAALSAACGDALGDAEEVFAN